MLSYSSLKQPESLGCGDRRPGEVPHSAPSFTGVSVGSLPAPVLCTAELLTQEKPCVRISFCVRTGMSGRCRRSGTSH